MWKLSFQAPPTALLELEHKLKVSDLESHTVYRARVVGPYAELWPKGLRFVAPVRLDFVC